MVELGSPDVEKLTTELGQFNGMANSIIRLQAGTLNELLSLIENNTDAIEQESFQSLIEGLSIEAKESWGELVLAANDPNMKDQKSVQEKDI